MCGRYGESKILEQVEGKVPFFRAESNLKPRYNIAPTQNCLPRIQKRKWQLSQSAPLSPSG